MKAYRNKILGMTLAAMCCFSPVSAFAAEDLTITSGLQQDGTEAECTFDESRVIYGEAIPYSDIAICVSRETAEGEFEEIYSDKLKVGSLGLFSTSFPLEVGSNYIMLEMRTGDTAQEKVEAVVKRVSCDVKTQLKRMIALPGLS